MANERNRDNATVLFAAANSGRGFASFYDDIFGHREIERRYLIKGGPGTGKSTFMKRVAEQARAEGFSVEYYRCSSDPDSLDAVVMEGRVAVMDATSPHSVDTTLPGARDEIVDLGQFWNSQGLSLRRAEIEELSGKKGECYRAAYRFLSAAMSVETRSRELMSKYVNLAKMRRAAARLTERLPDGEGYELLTGVRDSVGMKGRVCLDTYEKIAKRLYAVDDTYGLGSLFLSMIISCAAAKGNRIRVSYYPLDPSYPDAVLFEDCGVAFVLDRGECEGERISLKRFFDFSPSGLGGVEGKRAKKEYRTNFKLCEGLIQSACDRLFEAGEYHFALEEIYKEQMDFEKMENFSREFCRSVLEWLGRGR